MIEFADYVGMAVTTRNATRKKKYKSRRDPSPTYGKYPDRGCNLAPSCLDCPLIQCKHDRGSVTSRNLEILRLRSKGVSVVELVNLFGISQSLIYRILKSGN